MDERRHRWARGLRALAGAGVALVALSAPLSARADWLNYHYDLGHTGNDTSGPAATELVRAWTSAALDGAVYAEPLVVGSTVLVATENNSIYAIDISNGSVLWKTNLGPPVPNSSLPCGNVDPVGITGTPVIDPSSGSIFAVALLNQPDIHYELARVRISDGVRLFSERFTPAALDPTTNGQRGALALANGRVYVPFGGRNGDCGIYNGWIFGLPVGGGGPVPTWKTTVHNGAGLWTAGGLAVDGSGNIYGTSGNSDCTSPCAFDYSESVLKLSPTLGLLDYMAPNNWSNLNAADADLGGTGPTLLSNNLIFQVGKNGDAFLINATNMGHVGNGAYSNHACPNRTVDAAYGGAAYDGTRVYVPCIDGIEAVTINTSAPSFALAWHGPATSYSGPPIVADGLVWTIEPGGTLYGLNPTTGAVAHSASIGGAQHFATPAAAGGLILVAAGGNLKAFYAAPVPLTLVSPRTFDFGYQPPATTSGPRTVTITNKGSANLTISNITTSSNFNQTNTCPPLPAVLVPGASCGVNVTFSPTGLGAVSGTLTITDNGVGGPHTVALSGRGSYWSGWSRMAASMTSAPAVSTWGTNRLDVFARGQDNALYHTWYDGSWHYWSRIQANMTSAPTAVSWGVNRIDVFARGQDNALYHTYTPDGGMTWVYWTRIPASMTSAPSVSSWGSGRLDVFARGQDNALYHTWTTDGSNWNYWERLSASMTSDPAATSAAGSNRIDVFARGSDNALYSRTYDTTNGWQYWVRLGGNLASAPAASTWGVNRLDVFALGQDLAAYHLWSTDGGVTWNYWDRLDGSMSSTPASASWASGRIDLFDRGPDLALDQNTYSGP